MNNDTMTVCTGLQDPDNATTQENWPSHIFIIPYRDRECQRAEFIKHMPNILNADNTIKNYQIWIIHQCDKRLFNRGALLNIGFRIAQTRFPNSWPTIQFVFHDIDIMPLKPGIISYHTEPGKARHPYGDPRPQWGGILGCFCIIYGADYAKVGGSPNYFGWGGEDVALSRRCQAHGVLIDENNFILRRSCPTDIRDPESNPTPKQQAMCMACDKKNLAQVFGENPKNATNTCFTLNYNIIDKIPLGTIDNKIMQYDCTFEVTGF